MQRATTRLATSSLCTMNAQRAGSFSSTRPMRWPTRSSAGPCARWTCHRGGAVACAFASSLLWPTTIPMIAVTSGTAVRAAMTTVPMVAHVRALFPRPCPLCRVLSLSLSFLLLAFPVSFSRCSSFYITSLPAHIPTRLPLLFFFVCSNQTSTGPRATGRAFFEPVGKGETQRPEKKTAAESPCLGRGGGIERAASVEGAREHASFSSFISFFPKQKKRNTDSEGMLGGRLSFFWS